MSLCAYGSEPNPDFPPYIWVTWLDAKAWLGAMYSIFNWLGVAVTPALHVLSEFCAVEPEQPVYPGDDVVLAAARDPVAFERLLKYIKDCATWYAWSQACVCTAAPAGVCTSIAVPWTSLTNLGDPGDVRCYGLRFTPVGSGRVFYGAEVFINDTSAINRLILWDSTTTTILASKNVTAMSSGRQHILLDTPYPVASGVSYTVAFQHDGTQVYYHWGTNTAPATDSQCSYSAYHENLDYSMCPTADRTYRAPLVPLVCESGPPYPDVTAPDPPPLPDTDLPDLPTEDCSSSVEDLCALVQQLAEAIRQVRGQVDLIQRQNVPFSYLTGTVHTALTGSGSISVSGLIGLLIQTSTVPAGWGSSSDNPARYIPSPVSVTVGDAFGDQDQHFCHLAEELWFPTDMGAMTVVHYAFRPGCGGAITELRREF